MSFRIPNSRVRDLVLPVVLFAWASAARCADSPPNLKDVFQPYFQVGTAINRGITMGVSGRRSPEQLGRDVALVRSQFNQVTAENDTKWQLLHPRPGADGYEFGAADAFVEFGVTHRMLVVGHTLVWHSQTPDWVFAGTNPPPAVAGATTPATPTNAPSGARPGRGFGGPYAGPRASREELLGRMRDHIRTVVGRYRGRIKIWDVVNEALADGGGTNLLRNSLWLQIVGPDFIAKAFEYAHEADPDAILRYNDYGLEDPAKRRKLVALVKSLQEQRVPVHAIGSQAHLNVSIRFEEMDRALTEIAALGLPVHITELDINSSSGGQRSTGADIAANAAATRGDLVENADQRLAEAYAGVFRAFLKHRDSLKMVTFWGANDAVSWRGQGRPLLFDGEDQPKPAFEAVMKVARETAPKAP